MRTSSTRRRTVHHLTCAAIYYAVLLDEPCPLTPTADQAAFFSPDDGTVITAEQMTCLLLAAERGLMAA